jgi:hypothetical protein
VSESHVEIEGPEEDPAQNPPEGPYRNLWVPLVVVPAAIVMVIVIVFALFGAIAGERATPTVNLERILNGGSNERRQALYDLVAQLGENHRAQREGRPAPHAIDSGFLDRVRGVADELGDKNPEIRLTLGIALSTLEREEGTRILSELLELDDAADPEGRTRFYALMNLGLVGDDKAARAILPYLQHEDEGLRTVAAGALQGVRGEGVREGLLAALDDGSFEVRLTAALSLSKLEPPESAAAPLLRASLDPEVFREENRRDSAKYRRAELVSEVRVLVVAALARLGLEEDRALLEGLLEDSDLRVVAAAREVLTRRSADGPRPGEE